MTGREVIDVIEKAAPLEWYAYRIVLGRRSIRFPPHLIWRFDSKSADQALISRVADAVRGAVESFQGTVEWTCYSTGSNWVLLPTYVKRLGDSGQFRSFTDCLIHLAEQAPQVGEIANEELPRLAEVIAKALKV